MPILTTRQVNDLDRLTIAVSGTNRGIMFAELGDEVGRILPTTGDLVATEEFQLKADTLPDLLAEFLGVILEGIQEGIVYTLWQCTFSFSMPGNLYKLYVTTHSEEIDSLVEMDIVATKWFNVNHAMGAAESAEIVLRIPSILG